MRLVYLIGPPGVGKTAVCNELVREWGQADWNGSPVKHLRREDRIMLGWPDADGFGGTDRWAFNVGPRAVEWLLTQPAAFVLGEGDRMAVERWLRALNACVISLLASPSTLAQRRQGRTQAASWVLGRETKVTRLAAALRATAIVAESPVAAVATIVRRVGQVP